MLYRYRLYLEDSSEAGEGHYAARIKVAAPALCSRSDGRRVGRVADDDIVFSFRVLEIDHPLSPAQAELRSVAGSALIIGN